MTKICTISNVYNDPSGHGNLKTTLVDAKSLESSIKFEDVNNLFDSNLN